MIIAVIMLVLYSIATTVALVVSVKGWLRCSDKLYEVRDQIVQSLDMLNECFRRVSKTASREVLSDEPIIRELVNDTKMARDAILLVANKIVISYVENDKEDNT